VLDGMEWSGIGLGNNGQRWSDGTKAWWGPTFDDPFPSLFLHHADLSKLRNSGMPERKSRFGAGFFWNWSPDPIVCRLYGS
jgi:hypothetical protein